MKKLLIILAASSCLAGCQSNAAKNEAIEEARQAAVDSMQQIAETEAIKQAAIDSVHSIYAQQEEKEEKIVYVRDQTTASPATKTQRKKMNNTTKGALIGAGAGAITGAVVSKKKGQGAIIGGVVGAGAGAATGAIIDQQKKKNQ